MSCKPHKTQMANLDVSKWTCGFCRRSYLHTQPKYVSRAACCDQMFYLCCESQRMADIVSGMHEQDHIRKDPAAGRQWAERTHF